MTKIGYEIKCPCCKQTREFDLSSFNLFGDRLVLTCWFCNDYHISLDSTGIRQTFRYDTQEEKYRDVKPYYRFKEIRVDA